EVLTLADRAKNEPSFELPEYVLTILKNKHLMDLVAPGYDARDLLQRYGLTPDLKAA
ncbi:MAG: hypothetical protein INH43_13870, partial [Acidobacteriaceae bacterium]|nr:hypothetical protein [Acidobacteriaceae bacterium]